MMGLLEKPGKEAAPAFQLKAVRLISLSVVTE